MTITHAWHGVGLLAALNTLWRLSPFCRNDTDVIVAADLRGKPIVVQEITLRAILTRIDALACERTGDESVKVTAWDVVRAIEDRLQPLWVAIPNKIGAAPRSDARAIHRLYILAVNLAATSTRCTMTLTTPTSVAGWINLRHRRVEREYDAAYG